MKASLCEKNGWITMEYLLFIQYLSSAASLFSCETIKQIGFFTLFAINILFDIRENEYPVGFSILWSELLAEKN